MTIEFLNSILCFGFKSGATNKVIQQAPLAKNMSDSIFIIVTTFWVAQFRALKVQAEHNK